MIAAQCFKADGFGERVPVPLPARLGAMTGWRRFVLLTALGAFAALALPPVDMIVVLPICLPALIWAWDGAKSLKSAFLTGWFWALGFYSAGFYWIANALLTDAARFGWMIPFATLGLGGVVAVFPALALTAAHAVRASGPVRIVWVAVFWTAGEWLRTFVLTGFPWNPMGSVWDALTPVMQGASLFGVHGLSFMTVLSFSLPAALPSIDRGRTRTITLAVAIGFPLLLGAWGALRLDLSPTDFVPGVTLRMVQPALTQEEKWRPENREKALLDLVELSRAAGFGQVTQVIWPESAVPFDIAADPQHRMVAALAVPPHGLVMTGAPRIQSQDGGGWRFWNSLVAIDDWGNVQGVYDKVHLVPFGEYVPLRGLLPLPRVVSSLGDFSPGPGPTTLTLPGVPPVGPSICYESIFPGHVVVKGDGRPQWIVVITNDGWFGNSAGPYQHFAAARMRAIEEGLPVARAANTGISGMIDAYGRVVARLDLGQRGHVDAGLPKPAAQETIYGRYGDLSVIVLLFPFVLIAVRFRRR